MKVEGVLAKVYEPERLYWAWQRVKKNAGAVGIDRMTVDTFIDLHQSTVQFVPATSDEF